MLAAASKALPAQAEFNPNRRSPDGMEYYLPTTPPEVVPDITFSFGGDDKDVRRLSDFRGKVVLLNLWATWCPSCIEEMPSLDRLQAKLGGPDFTVLPVSMDRGGSEVIIDFYAEHQLTSLPLAIDNAISIARKIQPRGLPYTLLINRFGEEVGSSLGGEVWDSEASMRVITNVINAT